ncbi:MAG: hypothetical protein H0W72_01780 [Planctomycetes bacterium]|nr:hypothetical protein [Planctomycetota bacterium]
MANILTLTANTLLDHLALTPLALGTVTRTTRIEALAGGKGLNVARVLARHGHRVVATGFAGGDSGRQLVELVGADGIEPAFVTTAARTRIGFSAVAAGGGTTAVLEDGFAVTPAEVGALLARVRDLLTGIDLVIVSGSVPDPACVGLYRMVLDACDLAAVTCWVDAYGPAMLEALSGSHPPAVAKPNRTEYEHGRLWLACAELHLTDGAREVHVRHPQGRFRVTPPPVTEVNPIGSGDCYLAALAHARLSGLPLVEQLRYAAAAGAANAARADVARIAPSEIAALAEHTTVANAPE